MEGPSVTRNHWEPTRIPLSDKNVKAGRPIKPRALRRMLKNLERVSAYIPGEPRKFQERARLTPLPEIDGSSVLEALQMWSDQIAIWYDADVTHVLCGASFLRIATDAILKVTPIHWTFTMKNEQTAETRIYGLTFVVCPWMEGACPITDPATWPKPL